MKKYLSIILSLFMILSFFPLTQVHAEDDADTADEISALNTQWNEELAEAMASLSADGIVSAEDSIPSSANDTNAATYATQGLKTLISYIQTYGSYSGSSTDKSYKYTGLDGYIMEFRYESSSNKLKIFFNNLDVNNLMGVLISYDVSTLSDSSLTFGLQSGSTQLFYHSTDYKVTTYNTSVSLNYVDQNYKTVSKQTTAYKLLDTLTKLAHTGLDIALLKMVGINSYSIGFFKNYGLLLSEKTLTVKTGESASLTASFFPSSVDARVYWKTSDSYVASVNNGTVTGISEGTATITAYTADGISAECEVTVEYKPEEPIDDPVDDPIYFDPIEITVTLGQSARLPLQGVTYDQMADVEWRVYPENGEVSWDGVFTPKKAGRTIVNALMPDGSYAICYVNVLFKDVPLVGKYYSEPVYWAADLGITGGYSDGTFKPQAYCTREAVVTFLWRLAGKPDPRNMNSKFSDVQDRSKYYYKAVLWASENGITKGYSDGTFKPNATCLREHVVTFLYRYAGQPSPGTSYNPFNDIKSSDYYYKAVLWASNNGIANGYSSGAHAGGFGPKLDCLREHVVTFLYRFAK